jgi:hypothetical protein
MGSINMMSQRRKAKQERIRKTFSRQKLHVTRFIKWFLVRDLGSIDDHLKKESKQGRIRKTISLQKL